MITFKTILASIAATLLAASCNDNGMVSPINQGETAQASLIVNQTSVSFDQAGGEQSITITAPKLPTALSNCDWCSVEVGKTSSSKEFTIKLVAGPNRASAKSGNINITCDREKATVTVNQAAFMAPATASTTAITPDIVFEAIGPGWNMGNHLDAINDGVSAETVWGNPKCTQATMNGVKAAGFKSIRICTTWQGHIGSAPTYTIDEAWLSRVEEIVGYAEKAGLVAILNTHHDESYWLDIARAYLTPGIHEKTKDEIFCFWTQIAKRFQSKGEWLIFESMNEIQDGGWGYSDAFKKNPDAQYKVLNEWNQVFVDAVRSTGGNNATRWLGVPGYAASPGFTMKGLVLPKDYTSANRLMVAVHDYDPYNYTLNNPLVRRWGHTAESSLRPSNDDEAAVRSVFDQLKAKYIDNGTPVYLGEMGCSRHEADDLPFQKYYMEYFCKSAADHKLPMLLWDNGAKGTGPEKHAYIDHATGSFTDNTAKELVGIMVKAITSKDASYTLDSVYNSAP